jgi:hypothetical protein
MERIEDLNQRLIDTYGLDTSSSDPIWRIVYAWDQFEHRYGEYEDRTSSGLFIRRVTETRLVPKYRQWIREGYYVLENLCVVPVSQLMDLPATKVSYEPIFVYQNFTKNIPLPPIWSVTKLVIDGVHLAMGKRNGYARYKDMDIKEREKEFQEMYDYLYGDATDLTDALRNREAIVVPGSKEIN